MNRDAHLARILSDPCCGCEKLVNEVGEISTQPAAVPGVYPGSSDPLPIHSTAL
jgi:hypothetical protein